MSAAALVPYQEAVELILAAGAPPAPVTVPLADAVGRVTARAVVSAETSPNADLAAMDGYAVRTHDLRGATVAVPRRLTVAGSVAAGDPRPQRSAAGAGVLRIATGALLPAGYDAVLPVEDAVEANGTIEVTAPPAAGANVRRRGEDHRPGDVVLETGRRIEPPHLLLLANLGCARVAVARRPRVAVLATGSELVEDLTTDLQPGQVRNSNARYLVGALQAAGCRPALLRAAGDHPAVIGDRLRHALAAARPAADVIVTIGGVSRGTADHVPAALAGLGAEVLFHGVAMRPGKPVLAARLPERGVVLFGLPGNPLAVLATFRALVAPFLRVQQGQRALDPVAARLVAAVTGRPGLTRFVLGYRTAPARGVEQVTPVARQRASEVAALRRADRWLVVPPETAAVPAGAMVATLPL